MLCAIFCRFKMSDNYNNAFSITSPYFSAGMFNFCLFFKIIAKSPKVCSKYDSFVDFGNGICSGKNSNISAMMTVCVPGIYIY